MEEVKKFKYLGTSSSSASLSSLQDKGLLQPSYLYQLPVYARLLQQNFLFHLSIWFSVYPAFFYIPWFPFCYSPSINCSSNDGSCLCTSFLLIVLCTKSTPSHPSSSFDFFFMIWTCTNFLFYYFKVYVSGTEGPRRRGRLVVE